MRKLNYDVIQNSRFPFYSKIKTFIFFSFIAWTWEMSIFIRFNPNVILANEIFERTKSDIHNLSPDIAFAY